MRRRKLEPGYRKLFFGKLAVLKSLKEMLSHPRIKGETIWGNQCTENQRKSVLAMHNMKNTWRCVPNITFIQRMCIICYQFNRGIIYKSNKRNSRMTIVQFIRKAVKIGTMIRRYIKTISVHLSVFILFLLQASEPLISFQEFVTALSLEKCNNKSKLRRSCHWWGYSTHYPVVAVSSVIYIVQWWQGQYQHPIKAVTAL